MNASGCSALTWTGFEIATPPTGGTPDKPIPHVRPRSAPNYAVVDTGEGTVAITSYDKPGFIGQVYFSCGTSSTGFLPGYPKLCTLRVTITCQTGYFPPGQDVPSTFDLEQDFTYNPSSGDADMVNAEYAETVFSHISFDGLGGAEHNYVGCTAVKYTATGDDGLVALFIDDAALYCNA